MKLTTVWLCTFLLFAAVAVSQQSAAPAGDAIVPRLIRFTGQVKDASASTVGITFSLHKSPDDHAALWMETQNVSLDASGKYTVLLGATKSEGIPMELFTSGEAQWLAVHVDGKPEQARVLLVSVPYALKAAEAETLAGHAASEFVTADTLTTVMQQQLHSGAIAAVSTSGNQLTSNAVSSGPTNFTGNTTNQVVAVTQSNATGSGLVATAPAIAIKGTSTATTGTPSGLRGSAAAPGGFGVYGFNTATSGAANGVRGTSFSPIGIGVLGNNASANAGPGIGVKGTTSSASGIGVLGTNTSTTGIAIGVEASSASDAGTALVATETATGGATTGIQVTVKSPSGTAGEFSSPGVGLRVTSTDSSGTAGVFVAPATGVRATASGQYGVGVEGDASGTSGIGVVGNGVIAGVSGNGGSTGVGVQGQSGDTGVYGATSSTNSSIAGVHGQAGAGGVGVLGESTIAGVVGKTDTASGIGVKGTAYNAGATAGVFQNIFGGKILSGISGASTEVFSLSGSGQLFAQSISTGTFSASGNPAITGNGGGGIGLQGNSSGTAIYGNGSGTGSIGVFGSGDTGVSGSGATYGLKGSSSSTGVYGTGGLGVSGKSTQAYGAGVQGIATGANGAGVSGAGTNGEGVYAYDNAAGYGILAGVSDTTNGWAGWFNGNVEVDGTLSKAGGSFKIDHPLDPSNKYLYHSFVESPDMMNIYNGNITTDAKGDAVVHLPDWFEALNRDFRYQLTVMGQFAQAIVAKGVEHGEFQIKTDKPNVMVSWQVTGIRQDAWANANRIEVEVTKPEAERGFYLHPELFGQPEEKGVLWGRHPEAMKRRKEARAKAANLQ